MQRIGCLLLVLLLLLGLTGCGETAATPNPADGEQTDRQLSAEAAPDGKPYTAPPFARSAFHADKAGGNEAVRLDLSAVADGYVAVSAKSSKRLKFQVVHDDVTYNYDLASDETPSIFPLQSGDGTYLFRVMENVSESKYAELYSESATVKLSSEFAPFLCANDYSSYTETSSCVEKAREIAETAGDAVGVVAGVYSYVTSTVTYDREKAQSVQSGYLPNPDETMQTGKGICFDYASLAAAMLRSQGIPTKLVFGYVSPDDLYHAWNMFYTPESGWITVGYEVSADDWNRLDLTFSANGADGKFIGNGSNYTDVYFY